MKKRVKNNSVKRSSDKKEMKLPVWFLDGFVGVLALMIYNFLLYLFVEIGFKGLVKDLEDTMGYFGIKSFLDFGFTAGEISIGVIIIFAIAFIIGIGIGKIVRKRRGEIN